MKFLAILCAMQIFVTAKALASGCGRYDTYREIHTIEKSVTTPAWNDYEVTTNTAEAITLRNKASQELVTLEWEKSEYYHGNYESEKTPGDFIDSFYTNDLIFEEGNGCGPVYECITGQIVLVVVNKQKHIARTFVYPPVREASEFWGFPLLLNTKKLLPVFGNMRLPGTPMSDEDGKDILNKNQCRYGNW
ncbi:MAG: hypothetical protein HUU57_08070 [Bdellovibrio sp.]|nr:hypothetical protein [Bdellovibrio sp.]